MNEERLISIEMSLNHICKAIGYDGEQSWRHTISGNLTDAYVQREKLMKQQEHDLSQLKNCGYVAVILLSLILGKLW